MNTNNLRTFLQGDEFDPDSHCRAPWSRLHKQFWLQLSVVGFYAVIVSIMKGQDILKSSRLVPKWPFCIESGPKHEWRKDFMITGT